MTTNGSAALIRRFYAAFAQRDHATMAECYAPDAHFADPVFTSLDGARIGAMWRMLCERGTDLRVECGPVSCEGTHCSATWNAWYTFTGTGRMVHNIVRATFVVNSGLILRHDDAFDLYRWARQALGIKGLMLGWSPPVQNAIRAKAAGQLDKFVARMEHTE